MNHSYKRLAMVAGFTASIGIGVYLLVWNWSNLDTVFEFGTSREDILEYMETNHLSCRDNRLIWTDPNPDTDIPTLTIKKYD